MKEEIEIIFNPTEDEILGVFEDVVHVRGNDPDNPYIIVMSKKTYLKTIKNWLKGKQAYCERYDHYCGVMGYTFATKYHKCKDQITLNHFEFEGDDDEFKVTEVPTDVYYVSKFDDHHDFEHG